MPGEDDVVCEDVCDDPGAEETGAEELEVDFLAAPEDADFFAISCAVKFCAGCCAETLDDEVCCTVLPADEEEAPAEDAPDADEFGKLFMYVPAEFEFLAPALCSTPLLVPEEQLIRSRKVRINKAGKSQRFLFNFPFISYVPHIFIIQK